MAKEAKTIFCEGYIYPDTNSCGFEWLTKNGKKYSFDFDKVLVEIGNKIILLMEDLRSMEMFTEKWTHFKISLTEEGKIDFAFAYIPKDDYWPGLFMKGISELNEDELDTHNIPLEDWKECVKLKEQNKYR
ncbi:hypothetical protein [Acinetobacter bereziniae]|uniref:hypothetical protein n=1 Tax=Acinetobacter bereziniae TaxID=106648 RepID=UPI00300844E2